MTELEQIVYKGIRIDKKECIEQGDYLHIPRRLGNKFNINGYDLIPKSECISFMDYVKELEHYRDTTLGLFATDRPDLINDPQKIMFEITN
tara:strand:+ start:387 stop:659 length:273 start_codon:yes stop_codon:yes gene_type:complete